MVDLNHLKKIVLFNFDNEQKLIHIERVMDILERIERIEILTERIKEHCLCYAFNETRCTYFVALPEGYFPPRISLCPEDENGKIKTLEKILIQLEETWIRDFPYTEEKKNKMLSENIPLLLA